MSRKSRPLKTHLREVIDDEKIREAKRQIEQVGVEILGEYNFAHGPEAECLAKVPLAVLEHFIMSVKHIRDKLNKDFKQATKELQDDDE